MNHEQQVQLSKFERMVKDNRVRKMTPHVVFPDGSKEPIFFNDQGWFQADLHEACSLEQFYDEELWDGLLDGVKVALRKNDKFQDEALMSWLNGIA
jgi:hypothetical protein